MPEPKLQSIGEGLFGLLSEHFARAEQGCSQFTFTKQSDLDCSLVSLYLTILRHGESVRVLVENDLADCVPQVLRSMFEAFLDLVILEKDNTFGYRMEKSSLAQKLEMMDGWPDSVKQQPEWTTFRNAVSQRINELDQKNVKRKPQVSQCCKLADRESWYASIYRWLCCDVHHDLMMLLRRHEDGSTGELNLHSAADLDDGEIPKQLELACEMALESTRIIHRRFSGSLKTDDLKAKLEDLGSRLRSECQA